MEGGGGGGERTEEDLEIASIGSLYTGPWQKKYWSSSRGKDRYPYPIGYNAIRTHVGSVYRMEIHEGLQGPLFVVTSNDGYSGSGQTPDIAWEKLQKRCGPRVKNWHGKRFASKIDGVELFGFRNPFVQRLFRELVANIEGTAECSSVSPDICNGAIQTGYDIHIQQSRTFPNLLPYLGKKQSAGKRTMKPKCATKSASMPARSKRIRHQDIGSGSEGGNSKQGDVIYSHVHDKSALHLQKKEASSTVDGSFLAADNAKTSKLIGSECQNNGKNTGTSVKNCEENRHPGTSLALVSPSAMGAGNYSPFQPESKLVQAADPDCFVEKHVIFLEQSSSLGSGDSRPSNMEDRLHQADGIKLDRLLNAEVEGKKISVAPKYSNEEFLALSRASDVCVPDSLDTPKDNNTGSMENIKESLCSMKDQPIAAKPLLETSASSFLEVVTAGTPKDFINENQNCSSRGTNRMSEEVPYQQVYSMPGVERAMESLLEVGSSSGSSNASFGKIDLDLAGQELARSMMTFLLPRALPLLKKTYKRRSRNRNRKSKDDPSNDWERVNVTGENVENSHPTDATCQDKLTTGILAQRQEKNMYLMNTQQGNGPLCEMTKVEFHISNNMTNEPFTEGGTQKDVQSVIPDSFEDGPCACDVARKRSSYYNFLKSDIEPSNKVKHKIENSTLSANDTEQNKESLSCHFGSSGSNRVVMMPDKLNKGINFISGIPSVEVETPHVKNNSYLHFEGERICSMEENINSGYMPGENVSRNVETGHFKQCSANLELNTIYCGHDSIPITHIPQSFGVSGSPVAKNHISMGHHVVHSVPANLDSKYAIFPSQVDSISNPQMELDAKEVTGKGNSSSLVSVQEIVNSTTGPSSDGLMEGKVPYPLHSSMVNNVPLSESIICRNFSDGNPPKTYYALNINSKDCEVGPTSEVVNKRTKILNVANANGHRDIPETVADNPTSEILFDKAPINPSSENLFDKAPVILQIKEVAWSVSEDMKPSNFIDPIVSHQEKNSLVDANDFCSSGECHFSKPRDQDWCKGSSDKRGDLAMEVIACADKNSLRATTIYDDPKSLSNTDICEESHLDKSSNKDAICNGEFKGPMELVGYYMHLSPVSLITIIPKRDHLQICVVCGHFECNDRYVFIYVIPLHVLKGANPSFIGYTSLVFPLRTGHLNEQILFERSGLQFTPDGESLVFPSSIKAPCCREQNVNCSCSNCKSVCFEENAIRIVHVEFGYVSVVTKLATTGAVTCILVSKPNYLIAAEKSGKLHVWTMNLAWSVSLGECKLPSFDHISPVIVELKSIPKRKGIIIGQNGRGSFGLWDISNRVLLARFSTPGNMIFQMLPIGLFSWTKTCTFATSSKIEDHIKEAILTDDALFETSENPYFSSAEDISVWLLVSSGYDSEAQDEQTMKEPKSSPVGWRLALAAKSMVVMGSALDPRTSAINTLTDFGIIGTCDGVVYLWELSTGKKLSKLHSFQGGGVSYIAVDDKSGAVAVASDNGQLVVYLQSQTKTKL